MGMGVGWEGEGSLSEGGLLRGVGRIALIH